MNIEQLKKESAFDRDLSDGFEPELTGEYPQNPDTKNNLIEKKHCGKYQRYIRCAFKARERGESDKADHYLYKAMQEINTLSNWYDTPFVPCSHEYSDKVFALYKQVSRTPMIRQAFERFDIAAIKSRSLDWRMLWAAKHRLYLLGHLLCKYVIYNKKQ